MISLCLAWVWTTAIKHDKEIEIDYAWFAVTGGLDVVMDMTSILEGGKNNV